MQSDRQQSKEQTRRLGAPTDAGCICLLKSRVQLILFLRSCRLDEKISKLDQQLLKHKDAIKKTRGPAQEAAKRRALSVRVCEMQHLLCLLSTSRADHSSWSPARTSQENDALFNIAKPSVTHPVACTVTPVFAQVLKQKRLYEGQRDQLYGQQFNMDQTTFVMESAKDTVNTVQALKSASKEMRTAFKSKELNIDSIDKLQDELADMAVC